MAPPPVGADTASSWRPLIALLTANTISLVGSQFTAVAIPWFVLVTTGSAAKMGLVAFAELAPIVVASFFGGAAIDRIGHRRASILADLISGLTVGLVPLAYNTIGLAFWQLLALVAIGSFSGAPGATARSALIPDLTRLAGVSLERSTSAVQAVDRGTRLIGAPLAGVLIALLGPTAPLWIDAGTFLVSALIVTLLVPSMRPEHASTEQVEGGSYLADLRAGLRYVGGTSLTRAIVVTVMVTNFLDAAFTLMRPVYAQRVYGSALSLGLMSGALGGGALLGALAYGAFGARLPRRPLFVGGFVVLALSYGVFAVYPSLGPLLASLVVAGVAAGPINPILSTVLYERLPPVMRARVLGLVTAIAWMAMPLAVLISGLLIQYVGLRPFIVAVAGLYLAVALGMGLVPALRGLERRADDAPP